MMLHLTSIIPITAGIAMIITGLWFENPIILIWGSIILGYGSLVHMNNVGVVRKDDRSNRHYNF